MRNYASRFKRPLQMIVLCLITTASLCYIVFANESIEIAAGDRSVAKVALTFNVMRGDSHIEPLLQQLKRHRIRATFFVSGEWAERHPDLLLAIKRDHHQFASLGYNGHNLTLLTRKQLRSELWRTEDVFRKQKIALSHYFRPPTGLFTKESVAVLRQLNYKLIYWSLNGKSESSLRTDELLSLWKTNVQRGDIILYYAAPPFTATLAVLPSFLAYLQEKQLEAVTVDELLLGGKSETKAQ